MESTGEFFKNPGVCCGSPDLLGVACGLGSGVAKHSPDDTSCVLLGDLYITPAPLQWPPPTLLPASPVAHSPYC